MNDELRDELDELLLDHQEQDGGLTEAQRQRLNDLLRDDPEARRIFARTHLLDAALHLQPSSGIPADVSPISPTAPASRSGSSPAAVRPYAWIGVAATVMFLVGLGLGSLIDGATNRSLAEETAPTDDGVALLTRALNVSWTGDAPPRLGEPVSPGTLRFAEGVVQLEFYSGAQLIVEGPAELELVSSNRAICRQGKLRAKVPEVARGFTVLAPQFELVDLGTEFGLAVSPEGSSEVQVFDGEVEIYPPDGRRSAAQRKRLLGGSGIAWAASGETGDIAPRPESFVSFEDLDQRSRDRSQGRLQRWRDASQRLAADPRVAVHYDFEGEGGLLTDRSDTPVHGTIVGGERTAGRWPGKGALEFKRPGDRVRIDVPGEFEQLTLTAWLRMDAQTGRHQSLILTDGYESGHIHWQINPQGALVLGHKQAPNNGRRAGGKNYETSPLFDPRRIGGWTFLSTVFDLRTGEVAHYLNGREMSREPTASDLPVQIGQGDIGNWSEPLTSGKHSHPVRNFVGRMDELTIWKVALDADTILQLYRSGRP